MTTSYLGRTPSMRVRHMGVTQRHSKRAYSQQRAGIHVAWPNGHLRAKGEALGRSNGTHAMAMDGGSGRVPSVDEGSPLSRGLARSLPPQAPKAPRRNRFDRAGDLAGKVPMSIFVPAMFEIEFCAAMPLLNDAWRNLLAGPYHIAPVDYHVLPAELWAMTPLVGIPLGLTLFGTSGLPQRMHPWVQSHILDPIAQTFGENAARVVKGGLFFGIHPLIQEHIDGSLLQSTASFSAEMLKSVVLYAVTGWMLGLSLPAFLPAALGLAVFSNLGSGYINRVWGSLGKPSGRIFLANVGIFFVPHAISGMENVVREIPALPDGLGWGAQATIASLISIFLYFGIRKDAAKLKAREVRDAVKKDAA